jgi:hypothetical protein
MNKLPLAISLAVAIMISLSSAVSFASGAQQSPTNAQLLAPQTGFLPRSYSGYAGTTLQNTKASTAPMGVADYGYNAKTKTTYSYVAQALQGSVTFTKLSIGTVSKAVAGKGCMGIQLNAIAENFNAGGHSGTYWTQDVIGITQDGLSGYSQNCFPSTTGGKGTFNVYAEDNIWNFSTVYTSNPTMGPTGTNGNEYLTGALSGNCGGGVYNSGSTTYYACGSNAAYTVTLPFRVVSTMDVGIFTPQNAPSPSYVGDAFVQFAFSVYDGSGTKTLVGSSVYDLVAFNGLGSPLQSTSPPPEYLVSDTNTPLGYLTYDAEEVLCGPGSGSQVTLHTVAASIFESYQPIGSTTFKSVLHAYSYGSETAETAVGVHESYAGVVSKNKVVSAIHGTDNFVFLY